MKLAVMQPYFFPYLGYWQLISQANIFVIFDDVNYIKKGYVDRNYLVKDEETISFKLQIQKASQNKRINQLSTGNNKADLAETVRHVYRRAPYFKESYPFISELILCQEHNLALYLEHTIEGICKLLQISTQIVRSSDFQLPSVGKDKIIPLLFETGAHTYLNPIGGSHLYQKSEFIDSGKALEFFRADVARGCTSSDHHVSYASIIHFMFHKSPDELSSLVSKGSSVEAV